MPVYGWKGQIGWGEETTWGTAATINRFERFISESIEREQPPIFVPVVTGSRSRPQELYLQGLQRIGGEIVFPVWAKGLGLWFKHALGSVSSTQPDPNVWLHTFTPTDTLPAGLTIEVGRVTQFHKYAGCRVNELTIRAAPGEDPRLTIAVLGKSETIAGTGATASFPSGNQILQTALATFTIDGVSTSIYEFEVRISNNLRDDAFVLGDSTRASLDPQAREVTGRFRLPYDAVAQYQKFINFTTAALNIKLIGGTISGTYKFTLEVDLPVVIYEGRTPTVGGAEEEIVLEVPFRAVKGTSPEVTIKYQNNESAP